MINNVFNVVINDFVGDCNGLFWVVGVVIFYVNQFVVFNFFFGINVFNCLMCVVKFYIVLLGNWVGYCVDNGDFNIVSYSGV